MITIILKKTEKINLIVTFS